jgi:hypothetical protein
MLPWIDGAKGLITKSFKTQPKPQLWLMSDELKELTMDGWMDGAEGLITKSFKTQPKTQLWLMS